MIKKVFILTLFLTSILSAQKPQTIAYIDMEYILENLPNYNEAQKKLDNKVAGWRQKIEKSENDIEVLKTELLNEKILLTEDLIIDKQETIETKKIELQKLRARYFGSEGSLFLLRQQLVKPIQDEVYNAIQTIIKRKRYDFVFDRSSDLILLHANPKYDISKTVINYITKSKKEIEIEEAQLKKAQTKASLKKRIDEQRARREKKKSKIIHR
jgi:Skp family chaperone for outer membrane proteins